ncbi:MAG: hypothetical protein AB1405_02530, partial [Bdellovibrionota bacterium]
MRTLIALCLIAATAACGGKAGALRPSGCPHAKAPDAPPVDCETLQGKERDVCREARSQTAPPERPAPQEVE